MIEPKQFYRKMDRMLAQIANVREKGRIPLPQIMEKLESSFGSELHFGRGHLYRELFGSYELLHVEDGKGGFPARIEGTDPVIGMLLEHGSFVYEADWEIPDWYTPADGDAPEFVGLLLDGPPGHRYIMLFALRPGWVRAELAFCLNAVRFSLNYRLKSDAAEDEMSTAAAIQRSLLPKKAPRLEGWDIAARTEAAEAVGGDLYDYLRIDDQVLGLAVGDASGHGLPAALLVRDVMMGIRMGMGINMKMLYVLKKLNAELHRTTFSTRFISLFYGELGAEGGLIYANAGHTSGLIITDDDVKTLDPTGPIMGPLPDIPLQRGYEVIPRGAILALYTDGITERVREDGSPFEVEGLIDLIREHSDRDAAEIVWQVFTHVQTLGHESDLFEDDMTLVILKREA